MSSSLSSILLSLSLSHFHLFSEAFVAGGGGGAVVTQSDDYMIWCAAAAVSITIRFRGFIVEILSITFFIDKYDMQSSSMTGSFSSTLIFY